MINWFKNIFASKPSSIGWTRNDSKACLARVRAEAGGLDRTNEGFSGAMEGADLSLYQRVIDATNLTKPQYAVNFSLTKEERSARSRKAAATRKAKRETTARLNHENLRRALQASVDAA